jgi:hypothetical protein
VSAGEYTDVVIVINTLLLAEEGVIETDKVFEAVTNDVEDVVLVVSSVAVTTCKTFPPPADAKLKTPLPFV